MCIILAHLAVPDTSDCPALDPPLTGFTDEPNVALLRPVGQDPPSPALLRRGARAVGIH